MDLKRHHTGLEVFVKRKKKKFNFEERFDTVLTLKEANQLKQFEEALLELYDSERSVRDNRAQCAYELALLYCQKGVCYKAEPFLQDLGFKYRLGHGVWNHVVNQKDKIPCVPNKLYCYDSVLPDYFLHRLLQAFSLESSFWYEHSYPTDSFFSYNVPLKRLSPDVRKKRQSKSQPKAVAISLMTQLADYLKPLVESSFPEKVGSEPICSIEWWAHTRSNGPAAGHRLHYDLDEARLQSEAGESGVADGSIHPLVSSVLYLDDGGSSGAPTLIIDQKLSGKPNDCGWLVEPKTSQLLLFDGSLLHGVIPHIRKRKKSSGTRLTLMIGWWGEHVHTMPHNPSSLGPNMLMPSLSPKSHLQWPSLFEAIPEADLEKNKNSQTTSCLAKAVIPVHTSIWEPVRRKTTGVPELNNSDIIFIGNWFIKSKNEINDEILHSRATKGYDTSMATAELPASDVSWLSPEDLEKLRGGNS